MSEPAAVPAESPAPEFDPDQPLYLDKAAPEVFAAISAVSSEITALAKAAGLDRAFIELIDLRVSQINGCAYCLDLHVKRALKVGADARKLAVLQTWADTALFTEQERAALELAECITRIPETEIRCEIEERTRRILGDEVYAAVCWIAIIMNGFNRLSITSHHPVA